MKIKETTKKNIFLSIIIIFLTILFSGTGLIYYIVTLNSDFANNQQRILNEINSDAILKKGIGEILSMLHNREIIYKEENNNIEYVRMIAKGAKYRFAEFEYWVNKKDSIWKLDSLYVLQISDKRIKIRK